MSNERKNLRTYLLTKLAFITLSLCPCVAAPPFKIYISQITQHAALDASRQGVYDQLIESGLKEGEDFVWVYENSQGNIALSSQIAQKAVGDGADVIVTLGTSSSQTAVAATQKSQVPVVFASVTDPVAARLVRSLEKPGCNVTGVSNLTPALKQFHFFQQLQPGLKRLGVIYNPGEANSMALLADMKQAAEQLGIEIVLSAASKTSEVRSAAYQLVGKVDAFYVNNDNTALAAFQSIVQVGRQNNLPAYVSDIDLVEEGAMAALGPDQYKLGMQVGRIVLRILKGEVAQSIPVEFSTELIKMVQK